MRSEKIMLGQIPAVVWGEPSERVWLCVHGKLSCKEAMEGLAAIAAERGCQTIAFDLPEHGERRGGDVRCDVWHGTADLNAVADYAFARWQEVSLFACSLGAYFSLQALADRPLRRALFQSPIADMGYLLGQMMTWFGVTPERLEREQEIETPVDLMTWPYYQYVQTHPVACWPHPTSILYGSLDNLQAQDVMRRFAQRFGCGLTVAEGREHAFMGKGDAEFVENWLREHI